MALRVFCSFVLVTAISPSASDAVAISSLTNLTSAPSADDFSSLTPIDDDYALDGPSFLGTSGNAPFPELSAPNDPDITQSQGLLAVTGFNSSSASGRLLTETSNYSNNADVAVTGNYVINKCNSKNGTSHGEKLLHLIPQIQQSLQAVIQDIDSNGMLSHYGYSALFKTSRNAARVKEVFQQIIDGASLEFGDGNAYRPQLLCINQGDPKLIGAFNFCSNSSRKPVAFLLPRTNVVGLCDSFWSSHAQYSFATIHAVNRHCS